MNTQNNPLKQYFRRPALYMRLPSHPSSYKQGVIDWPENYELPVYPMTAIDEITARTPDALFNGNALTHIIASCVPNIKQPWEVHATDLDSILIAIRLASNGEKMEIDSVCPSCTKDSKYDADLSSMLMSLSPGDYETTLQVDDLEFKFKPLTLKEIQSINISQFELQKQYSNINQENNGLTEEERTEMGKKILVSITDLTMAALSSTIEYIKTPGGIVDNKDFILDYMKNCSKKVFVKLRDHSGTIKSQTEIKPLKISCPHCNHQYEQAFTLNISDFFE